MEPKGDILMADFVMRPGKDKGSCLAAFTTYALSLLIKEPRMLTKEAQEKLNRFATKDDIDKLATTFLEAGLSVDQTKEALQSLAKAASEPGVDISSHQYGVTESIIAEDTRQNQLNQLLDLFTSVRGTTRESAESISTGLNSIFTRLGKPATI